MTKCKYESQLIDLCHDELSPSQSASLKRHIKDCARCRQTLVRISALSEDTKKLATPYPTAGEWAEILERGMTSEKVKARKLTWKPALAGIALATAAAVAAIVIINKPTPPTEAPLVVAETESSEMQRSGGPSAVAKAMADKLPPPSSAAEAMEDKPRPEDAAMAKLNEGEDLTDGILAKDSTQPRRGVLQYAPTETAADVTDTPDESPLRFHGAAAQVPQPSADGGVKPSGAAAAQPASRIPENPAFTPSPISQKDKVVIKHNRINPSRGETMTISVKSEISERVTIRIYDSLGQLVRVLADAEMSVGVHEFRWAGNDDHGAVLASGIYLIVIEAPGFKLKKKGVIVK